MAFTSCSSVCILFPYLPHIPWKMQKSPWLCHTPQSAPMLSLRDVIFIFIKNSQPLSIVDPLATSDSTSTNNHSPQSFLRLPRTLQSSFLPSTIHIPSLPYHNHILLPSNFKSFLQRCLSLHRQYRPWLLHLLWIPFYACLFSPSH